MLDTQSEIHFIYVVLIKMHLLFYLKTNYNIIDFNYQTSKIYMSYKNSKIQMHFLIIFLFK